MRWSVLVVMAGCNQFYGIDETALPPDADPNSVCAPLTYDARRYAAVPGPLTWQDARDTCAKLHGMDLVVFDEGDSEELSGQQNGAPTPYWIGISHGPAGWESRDMCRPHSVPVPGSTGECVVQTASGPMKTACTATSLAGADIGALCETPRPSLACRTAAASTYMVISGLDTTRSGADTMCTQLPTPMHVVEINSSDELATVGSLASTIPNFWVAARSTGLDFTGITDCPQVFAWKVGEPGISTTIPCVRDYGGMETVNCDNTANVVCESN